MLGTLSRVIIGFALACLAAGIAIVAFVITPGELANLSGDAFDNRLAEFFSLSLRAGTHAAIFAAPFALILAAIAEWQSLRGPTFYIFGGLAIALAGFLAQHWSETAGQHTVLNDYAIRAFLATGLFSGLAYWLVAGRSAGSPLPAGDHPLPRFEHKSPQAAEPAAQEPKAPAKAAAAKPNAKPETKPSDSKVAVKSGGPAKS